jgi:ribosomal protein S18 acetylase RimI-like enzyme
VIIRSTIRADLGDLAELHAQSLPSSLFTALGRDALIRYYAYVESSPYETAWTAAVNGLVAGACVVSYQPQSVLSRFVRHAPIVFARELGALVVRDSVLRTFARELGALVVRDSVLRTALAQRLREPAGESHAPEVTQIFTDARHRGHGIGAALLRSCEANLRTRGVARYFVHTERDDNDAGIRFYRREGFEPIGESRSFGRAFLVMKKDL